MVRYIFLGLAFLCFCAAGLLLLFGERTQDKSADPQSGPNATQSVQTAHTSPSPSPDHADRPHTLDAPPADAAPQASPAPEPTTNPKDAPRIAEAPSPETASRTSEPRAARPLLPIHEATGDAAASSLPDNASRPSPSPATPEPAQSVTAEGPNLYPVSAPEEPLLARFEGQDAQFGEVDVFELSATLRQYADKRAMYEEQVRAMDERIAAMRRDVADAEAVRNDLERAQASAKEARYALRAIQEELDKSANATKQLTTTREELLQEREKAAAAVRTREEAASELSAMTDKAAEAAATVERLEAREAELESTRDALTEKLEALKKEAAAFTRTQDESDRLLESMSGLDAGETQQALLENLRQARDAARRALEDNMDRTVTLEEELAQTTEALETARKERDDATATRQEAIAAQSEAQARLETLDGVETSLVELNEKLETVAQQLTAAEAETAELRTRRDALLEEARAAETRAEPLATVAADIARIAEDAARMEKDKALYQAKLDSFEAIIARLQNALKRAQQAGFVVDASLMEPKEEPKEPTLLLSLGDGSFASGQEELSDASKEQMQQIAFLIKSSPGFTVSVEGHTDNQPIGPTFKDKFSDNLDLSLWRARTVAAELIDLGVARERVSVTGFGDTRPLASNDSPQGRAKNRRVEIWLNPAEQSS